MSIHPYIRRSSPFISLALVVATSLAGCSEPSTPEATAESRRATLHQRVALARAHALGADECIAQFEACTDDPATCEEELIACLSDDIPTGDWPDDETQEETVTDEETVEDTDTITDPEEDFPEEDFPEEDFPEEDFPEEDFPEEDFPEEDFPEEDFPELECVQMDWGNACDQAAQSCWEQAATQDELNACIDEATSCYEAYFCGDESPALTQCREMMACWDDLVEIDVWASIDLDICESLVSDTCSWLRSLP